MDFQSAADNSGLRVDEKISEIIQYYVIIERNRKKVQPVHAGLDL